ncbi:MAG: DUF169 domain-containing protein [Tissierellia bacterium]|nr:DUF169 domain-containing protein [Tissierellia bacterium]
MDIRQSAIEIKKYLDLDRLPVGVRFLRTKEEYDNSPARVRDSKITYCNSVHFASMGDGLKLKKEHQACPKGSFALGLTPEPEGVKNGQVRYNLGLYDTLETSKKMSEKTNFIKEEIYAVELMPLEQCEKEPDVVIVVSGSYNIMRLIQGYSYKHGYSPNISTVGLQALCRDLTAYPFNEDDINISFLCPGTRLVANWKEHELGFATSISKWYDIVEGVIKTTNPFERDKNKKKIEKKMDDDQKKELEFGHNYDSGAYFGGKVEE